jgi:hypothetical protein
MGNMTLAPHARLGRRNVRRHCGAISPSDITPDLVPGKDKRPRGSFCDRERSDLARCGPEGRHWESVGGGFT